MERDVQRLQGLPLETGGRKERENPIHFAAFMSGPFEAQGKLKP